MVLGEDGNVADTGMGWRTTLRLAGLSSLAVAGLATGAPVVATGAGAAGGAGGIAGLGRSAEPRVVSAVFRTVGGPLALATLLALPADLPPAAAGTGAAGISAALPVSVPAVDVRQLSGDGIPVIVLAAYRSAAAREAVLAPHCGLTWPVLAGIGRVESNHGRDVPTGGGITADGTVEPPLLGPVLDGTNGTAAVPDGSGGWSRAVGPMQFLSSTWSLVGVDGNGDGRADANNVWDASLGAARYLCAGGRSLVDPAGLAGAVFSYNHSDDYVRLVLQLTARYANADPAALLRAAGLTQPTASSVPTSTHPAPTGSAPAGSVLAGAAPTGPAPAGPAPTGPAAGSPPPTSPAPSSPPAPAEQVITFTGPAVMLIPDPATALTATGGGSGLPVTFLGSPARVCQVNGSTLLAAGPGACTVVASEAGTSAFLAAVPVTRTVLVGYQLVVIGDLSRPIPAGQPVPLALALPAVQSLPAADAPAVTATAVDGTPLNAATSTFLRGADGIYRWTLPTRGLGQGPHTITVTVAADPTTHVLPILVR